MRCDIRPALPRDVPALARLSGELGYPSDSEQMARRLQDLADSDRQVIFVADTGSGVVGWVHVQRADRLESGSFAEICGLVVTEELRGQGVGSALLDFAETWSRSAGLDRIRVRSRVERTAAHRFYARRGFFDVKTQQVLERDLGGNETPAEGA